MIEKEGAGGDRKEKHMGVVGPFSQLTISGFFSYFFFFFFFFFEGTLVLSRRGGAHALYTPVKMRSRGDHAPAGEFNTGWVLRFLQLLRAFNK